jgi:CheY-like chemotaxis protein
LISDLLQVPSGTATDKCAFFHCSQTWDMEQLLLAMDTSDRPTILIADDEPAIVRLITRCLPDGFDCLCAPDGVKALELVRGREIQVAVLDIRMPRLCGLDVARQLLARSAPPMVILVSASLPEPSSTGQRTIQQKVFACVSKPFCPIELQRTIAAAVAAHPGRSCPPAPVSG